MCTEHYRDPHGLRWQNSLVCDSSSERVGSRRRHYQGLRSIRAGEVVRSTELDVVSNPLITPEHREQTCLIEGASVPVVAAIDAIEEACTAAQECHKHYRPDGPDFYSLPEDPWFRTPMVGTAMASRLSLNWMQSVAWRSRSIGTLRAAWRGFVRLTTPAVEPWTQTTGIVSLFPRDESDESDEQELIRQNSRCGEVSVR